MILNNINNIKKILGPRNVRRFYTLIPLDILASILDIISISVVIPFVIAISDKEMVLSSKYSSVINNNFTDYNDFIMVSGITLIGLLFISTSLSIYSTSKLAHLANKIGQETSQLQYEKYLRSQYKFHSVVNKTELTKTLISEVSRFTQNVLIASLKMISKFAFLLIIVVFMLVINPLTSFVIFLSLAVIYVIIFSIFKSRLLKNGKEISSAHKSIYRIISESLNGIKETKFYGLENYYLEQYISNSNIIAERTASSQTKSIIPKNIVEFLLFSVLILIIIYLNANGKLIESLPLITFYLYTGYRALPALQQVYNSSALIKANYESVNQILKYEHLITVENQNEAKVKNIIDNITVKDISFGYKKDQIFLNNLSLKFNSPSFIGIIGKSGSGKSSLIDLLLKLIHPVSGEIFLDDYKYDYNDAKSLFAYVPQNIYLSDSTLLDNIRLGRVNDPIDNNLIQKSCELSGLSTFVEGLPEKMKTQIGENGSLLSGGQRKRVGLARAIYSKKPILILDEVTSGLDSATESNILVDLKKMSKNKLVILVTHNIENLSCFDSIINFDKLL